MNAICLKFYVNEYLTHQHHQMVHEWLIEQAKKMGIRCGSSFKTVAGFGHHGDLHKDRFIGFTNDVPVEVEFILNEDDAERLLNLIKSEGLTLFYIKHPVQYGVINSKAI